MQIESLSALYTDEDYPALAGEKLYRVQYAGNRHYIRESGELYRSLTTLLKKVQFAEQAQWLETWRDQKEEQFGSKEAVEEYVNLTADYGSALHISIADTVRAGSVVWADLFDHWLPVFQEQTGDSALAYTMTRQLQYELASILKFFSDYRVKVLAIELPVWSKDGYATLTDLVGVMDAIPAWLLNGNSQAQRVPFIGDFKSSRKGFHESHEMQLVGCRKAFNEIFGGVLPIQQILNIAPKSPKEGEVQYRVKDWTLDADKGNKNQLFDSILQTARLSGVLSEPGFTLTEFSGETKVGSDPTANIRFIQYGDKARQLAKNTEK